MYLPCSSSVSRSSRNQCQRKMIVVDGTMFHLNEPLYDWQTPCSIFQRQQIANHMFVPKEPIVRIAAVLSLQIVRNVAIQTVVETVGVVEDLVQFVGDSFFNFRRIFRCMFRSDLIRGKCGRLLCRALNRAARTLHSAPCLIHQLRAFEQPWFRRRTLCHHHSRCTVTLAWH